MIYITDTQYETLTEAINKSYTIKTIKEYMTTEELEQVTSSSTNSYAKLKEDYISVYTNRLIGLHCGEGIEARFYLIDKPIHKLIGNEPKLVQDAVMEVLV